MTAATYRQERRETLSSVSFDSPPGTSRSAVASRLSSSGILGILSPHSAKCAVAENWLTLFRSDLQTSVRPRQVKDASGPARTEIARRRHTKCNGKLPAPAGSSNRRVGYSGLAADKDESRAVDGTGYRGCIVLSLHGQGSAVHVHLGFHGGQLGRDGPRNRARASFARHALHFVGRLHGDPFMAWLGHFSGLHRLSKSELVTTLTLESAIAPPASMGERKPRAASGMPMTL